MIHVQAMNECSALHPDEDASDPEDVEEGVDEVSNSATNLLLIDQ